MKVDILIVRNVIVHMVMNYLVFRHLSRLPKLFFSDCTCSCKWPWTGPVCDVDAYFCSGEDVANASYCNLMTGRKQYEAFCDGDKRLGFQCVTKECVNNCETGGPS